LYRNRIALLQKEEERSRKKIEHTKEKAAEIVALRIENDKKVNEFAHLSEEENNYQLSLRRKNLKYEIDSRRQKIEVAERINRERKYGVTEMKLERNALSDIVIIEREREFVEKKTRHELIKQMQEEAKRKREFEREERERRHREALLRKAQEEEIEARKAEQIIKLLEMKEKEWISKLREAQRAQEETIREIEEAVQGEKITEETLTVLTKPGKKSYSKSFADSAGSPQQSERSKLESAGSRSKI
jgi:hypothetical protein